MHSYLRFILKNRALVLSLIALTSLLALASLTRARLGGDPGEMALGEDPALARFEDSKATFGTPEEGLVVGFELEEPLSPESVRRLEGLAAGLEKIGVVKQVVSVLDVPRLRPALGIPPLQVQTVGEILKAQPERAKALHEELRRDPLVSGLLLGADGRSVALAVELERLPPEETSRLFGILDAIRRIAGELGLQPEELRVIGVIAMAVEMLDIAAFNMIAIFPFTSLLLLGTVWILFRRVWPAALSLTVSLLGSLWTMGLVVVMEPLINPVLAIVPIVVMVVGFADIVHLCSAYLIELDSGKSKDDAILASGEDVGRACFYTSLTTGVGFLSLSLIPTPAIRVMGIALGFGVGISLLLAMTLAPILFSLLPPPPTRSEGSSVIQALLDAMVGACERLALGAPRSVIAVFLGVTALALIGASQIVIETDLTKRLAASNRLRRDIDWFTERFANTNILEVVFRPDDPEAIVDPAWLARIRRFATETAQRPEVESVISLLDVQDEVMRALRGEGAPPGQAELKLIRAGLRMPGRGSLPGMVEWDTGALRLAIRVRSDAMRASARLGDLLAEDAKEHMDERSHVEVSGIAYLFGAWLERVLVAMRDSLGTSCVIIAWVMIIALRSLRLGLLSMLPNLFPVICLGGWVGVAWEQMDSDVVIMAILAIGIGVDDTIHFLTRYVTEARRPGGEVDRDGAIKRSFAFAGRAILMTTIILVAGFLPFVASDYVTIRFFGTLLPMCLVTAVLADLLLVPAMIKTGLPRV